MILIVNVILAVQMLGLGHDWPDPDPAWGADMGPPLVVAARAAFSVPAAAPTSCPARRLCWRPCFVSTLALATLAMRVLPARAVFWKRLRLPCPPTQLGGILRRLRLAGLLPLVRRDPDQIIELNFGLQGRSRVFPE